MAEQMNQNIILYKSSWCAHSLSVERFLDENDIEVNKINIDGDQEARQKLMEINDGYASVPTLVFSDGSRLTEPSLAEVRNKLGIVNPAGWMGRIRGVFGQKHPSKTTD